MPSCESAPLATDPEKRSMEMNIEQRREIKGKAQMVLGVVDPAKMT